MAALSETPSTPSTALPAQQNDPVAGAGPQAVAPPWFQDAIQQLHMDLQNVMRDMIAALRAELLPEIKRVCFFSFHF